RLAVIDARQGQPAAALRKVRQALERTRGVARVPLLMLGARFAVATGRPAEAAPLLHECTALDPTHTPALAALAAVLWSAGDFPQLTTLADRFDRAEAADPWLHSLPGAPSLVAG